MVQDLADSKRWPTLGFEAHEWIPRREFVPASRRVQAKSRGPYRSAVVAQIAGIDEIPLPAADRLDAVDAATEIARFDAGLGAEIAPFGAILLRTESTASSRIENLTASARAIALAELGDTRVRNATSIVSNTHAMQAAVALADRLDGAAIIQMHAVLLRGEYPDWVGHWRTEQVWIGGSDYSPHDADFVPPFHPLVPAAMDDLVAFIARVDVHPLIQAAVAHAQFETIHPFPDGNGRTGRALVHAILRGKGLTRNVTVPVSAGLLTDTSAYFDALTAYREGDPAPIVRRFTAAAFSAIGNGTRLVEDLRETRSNWEEVIRARRGSAAWRLADLLVRQPVVDAPLVQRELGVGASNALVALGHLEDAGIVHELTGSRRNRRWETEEVLRALDDFARRSGRRGG
jgi:Fic family protein